MARTSKLCTLCTFVQTNSSSLVPEDRVRLIDLINNTQHGMHDKRGHGTSVYMLDRLNWAIHA